MSNKASAILLASILALQSQTAICAPSSSEIAESNKLFYQNSDKLIPLIEKKLKTGKDKAYWSEVQARYNLRNARRDVVFSFYPARQAAMLEPTNDHYMITWAMTLAEINKREEAQEIIDKVLKRSPKDARAHAVQAYLISNSGANNAFAEEEIKNAIKLDSKDPDVNYFASLVYKKLVNEKEYAQALKRWVQSYPQDAMAHHHMSRFYFEIREKDKGIEEGKIALKINPNFRRAQMHMIEMLHNLGRYKELIAFSKPVLTPDRHEIIDEDSWTKRADAYRYFKQFDKAADDYAQALVCLLPNTPVNQFSKDIKHFSIHMRRRYFEIWLARCQMLSECGKSDQALLDISKMILAIPENPGARQARIEILEKMQKYDQALKDVDFLIAKDPDIAEWYKMKAKFQRKLNKPKDAAATEKRMKDVIEFGSK